MLKKLLTFIKETYSTLLYKLNNPKKIVTITEITTEGPKILFPKTYAEKKNKELTKGVYRPSVGYTASYIETPRSFQKSSLLDDGMEVLTGVAIGTILSDN